MISGRLIIRLLAFVALVAVIAGLFWTQNAAFLSEGNLRALMRHMSVQGLAALGLTFVIVVRQFDLSFPGVASLGAMTLGWLIASGMPLSVAVCGGLAVGIASASSTASPSPASACPTSSPPSPPAASPSAFPISIPTAPRSRRTSSCRAFST